MKAFFAIWLAVWKAVNFCAIPVALAVVGTVAFCSCSSVSSPDGGGVGVSPYAGLVPSVGIVISQRFFVGVGIVNTAATTDPYPDEK